MHENSLLSYIEEKESKRIDKRSQEIVSYLRRYKLGTAREIMIGLDYDDLNKVRPRLSELKQENIIFEVDKIKCLWSGKTVSVFALK